MGHLRSTIIGDTLSRVRAYPSVLIIYSLGEHLLHTPFSFHVTLSSCAKCALLRPRSPLCAWGLPCPLALGARVSWPRRRPTQPRR